MHLFIIFSVDDCLHTDSLDSFTATLTRPGGPELFELRLFSLLMFRWIVILIQDLQYEKLGKDEIVVTSGEPAHVTTAADDGRPEIKSDTGSFIILAQSRTRSVAWSSKWLVVFDPLAQVCQNSFKSTAASEDAFSVSPRNSTASQRTLRCRLCCGHRTEHLQRFLVPKQNNSECPHFSSVFIYFFASQDLTIFF